MLHGSKVWNAGTPYKATVWQCNAKHRGDTACQTPRPRLRKFGNPSKHLGISTKTVLFDVKQLLALPDEEILRRLGVDVVILPRLVPSVGVRIDEYKPGQLPNDGGECLLAKAFEPRELPGGGLGLYNAQGTLIAVRPSGGLYFDEVYSPLAEAESEAEIDNLSMPSISGEEVEWLRARQTHPQNHGIRHLRRDQHEPL